MNDKTEQNTIEEFKEMVDNQEKIGICPHCGWCPHCGRPQPLQPFTPMPYCPPQKPYHQWYPDWLYWPMWTTTC